ncbi:MAG: S8 family serine peptidase [Gammaproteobacteria bacterium]|nr:S8 family serine peptidase [Gammaproteobacteria bacterium]
MKNSTKLAMLGVTAVFTLSTTSIAVAEAMTAQYDDQALPIVLSDDSTTRYIVKYKNDSLMATQGESVSSIQQASDDNNVVFSEQKANSVLRKHNVDAIMHLGQLNASVVELTPKQLAQFKNDPSVLYVEEDPKRFILDVPTIKAQSTPYGITMVQADQVSDANATNMKVCIIDTGYTLSHSDLPNTGVSGFAFSGHGSWNSDGNGHGTHVAGTMLALNNNSGVIGVLPSAKAGVHIVKIFNDAGNWTFASDLVQGIQSCKDAGAKVVNMSLGGGSASTTEQNAMTSFYNSGMLLIAAAGNSGNTSLSYPASYDAVVSVAAVDSSRNLASFSQRNAQVELAGPGVGVNSTWNNGGYNSISGTSMASPHVAAVTALVWSNHPQCTAPQIRSALNRTAQDRGTSGRDNSYGYGIVQAKAAHDELTNNGCSGDGGTTNPPGGGATFPNLSGSTGQWLRGSYTIPAGVSTLTFSISGGTGDADLYVRFGSAPTASNYTCRPYLNGNNEVCTINNPQAGTWHVGLLGYASFSGVTFSYQY